MWRENKTHQQNDDAYKIINWWREKLTGAFVWERNPIKVMHYAFREINHPRNYYFYGENFVFNFMLGTIFFSLNFFFFVYFIKILICEVYQWKSIYNFLGGRLDIWKKKKIGREEENGNR